MSAAHWELSPPIRAMGVEDVLSVVALEAGNYEFPWSASIFRDCLRAGYCCHVLEHDGVVAGYGVMSVAADEAHLLNLGIRPSLRRQGWGRGMLAHLLEVAVAARAERMFLEVRPSNRAALALYEAAGFARIGVRKAYYRARGGREDAVVLAKALGRGRRG